MNQDFLSNIYMYVCMSVFIYYSVVLLQSGTAMWVMPVIYHDNGDVFLMNFGPNGRVDVRF